MGLMMEMPKGAALINTARAEVIHEEDMLEVLRARPDFCYLCDVAPKKAKEMTEAVGDEYMKRLIFTKKKMGAQTLEVNIMRALQRRTRSSTSSRRATCASR